MDAYKKGYYAAKGCRATVILEKIDDLLDYESVRLVNFYRAYHSGWNSFVKRNRHKK